jgi:type II secretion system protein N
VASTLEAATGARAAVGRVAPGLTLLGPQLRAYDVDLAWPGGPRVQLARARARPAWSLSWLSGEPSLALELRSDLFEFDGTVRLGEAPAVRGRLSGLALARLPEGALGPGVRADGRLDADVDLRAGAAPLPEGALSLHARDGSLSLPGVPIGIPFARLDGELVLGGDAQVVLDSLALDGPLGALRGQGRIGTGPDLESSPLALEVRLEAKEPALRQLLAAEGVTLGPDGGVDLAVGGTLGEPRIVPRTAAPPGPARRPP